ncbi:putative GPI-anchored protein At4g28100 [Apium graveolens]|uniref:putative GPI-anchored protein At4g28100 n=1 Tax=Apium graveolens TaxID=4045 RepID=UPI003D7B88B0
MNCFFFILQYSISQAMFYYFPIIFCFHLLLLSPSLSSQSPPPTIPAFLEQSDVSSGCTLQISDDLFTGINDACAASKSKGNSPELHRSRCCPVLAAWLYKAYSDTALGRGRHVPEKTSHLPMLPDESETCVKNLEKGLKNKGMNLLKPNATCDLVYCYCGITLHPLSCPESFFVSPKTGKLVGDSSVKKLEKNCLSTNLNGFVGLHKCSNCLNTLYLLNEDKTRNSSKSEERNHKMHSRDCELMGLTWLLAKNRSAYIHTVSEVLRAIMMNKDGSSSPQSCSLNSDGMPLPVNSFEINSQPSLPPLPSPIYLLSTTMFIVIHNLIV